jgi:Tfp pilus assembly protein PilO
MLVARTDRLWMIGGVLGGVVLLAIGWFFFIGPQKAQTAALTEEAGTAQLRLGSLRHKLVELREQNTKLPQYRAQLAENQQALPTTAGLSDVVRQLQNGGDRTGVAVSGVLVGAAQVLTAADRQVFALPVTLTATGSIADLSRFLDQLQRVQPRAMLVSGVVVAPEKSALTLAGAVTLNLGVQVFVASLGDAEAAPAATKTN